MASLVGFGFGPSFLGEVHEGPFQTSLSPGAKVLQLCANYVQLLRPKYTQQTIYVHSEALDGSK